MLRGLLRGPAAIVLPLLIVASCGPDTAQAYYAYVENRSGEPAVVVPLADDGAVWFQDDFYRVPPDGARWWAGGGPIYSVRAAVVVYDSSCRFRGRVYIAPNAFGFYVLRIDAGWTLSLERLAEGPATSSPPLAPDNAVPCVTPPPGFASK